MKLFSFGFLLTFGFCVLSCSDDSGSNKGELIFFIDRDWGCGTIDIQLEDMETKTLTTFYTSGFPECLNEPEVLFRNISYGTYNWTGQGDFGCTWEGNITVNDDCISVLLTESQFFDRCMLFENEPCLAIEIEAVSRTDCPGVGFSNPAYNFTVTNNCEESKAVFLCYEMSTGGYHSKAFTGGIQVGFSKVAFVCEEELPVYTLLSQSLAHFQMYNCGAMLVNCE